LEPAYIKIAIKIAIITKFLIELLSSRCSLSFAYIYVLNSSLIPRRTFTQKHVRKHAIIIKFAKLENNRLQGHTYTNDICIAMVVGQLVRIVSLQPQLLEPTM